MDLSVVDASATRGGSPLHRASPRAKLAAFALVLAAVVVNDNVLVVAAVALALAAAAVASRLPARAVLGLAAYPAVFAAIFAWAADAGLLGGSLMVAKAVTAALAAVLLMFTTPYPQVFAPLQSRMPLVVGDAMLVTYRSLFLLFGKFASLLRAVRLRAGLTPRHPLRSARVTTAALGGLLLFAFDLSQRDYDVMRLRGYEGRLRAYMPRSTSRTRDAAVLAAAAVLLAAAVVWRVWWRELNPVSWLPPLLAAAALLAALAVPKGPADDR